MLKIEKRVYDHDEAFMKMNANFDSLSTSFMMMSPTISSYDDRLTKSILMRSRGRASGASVKGSSQHISKSY